MIEAPDHLSDFDLLEAINSITLSKSCTPTDQNSPRIRYYSSVGFLIKLLKGVRRLQKREKIVLLNHEDVISLLSRLWEDLTVRPHNYESSYWTPERLYQAADEVNKKCVEISPSVAKYVPAI
jgi:hypothetical protein